MKPFLRTLTAASLALVAAPGCFDFNLDGRSRGELGHVELSYADGGWDCLFGCGIGLPLLLGTSQRVRVEPVSSQGNLPAFKAVSSDPTVLGVVPDASLEPDAEAISVTGLRAGTATIVFFTADGALFDEATMRVEAGASVQVDADIYPPQDSTNPDLGLSDVSMIDMNVGDDAILSIYVDDAQGEGLAAWGATSVSIDDPSIAELTSSLPSSLTGKAKGTTTLHVKAQELSFTVPVTVH